MTRCRGSMLQLASSKKNWVCSKLPRDLFKVSVTDSFGIHENETPSEMVFPAVGFGAPIVTLGFRHRGVFGMVLPAAIFMAKSQSVSIV